MLLLLAHCFDALVVVRPLALELGEGCGCLFSIARKLGQARRFVFLVGTHGFEAAVLLLALALVIGDAERCLYLVTAQGFEAARLVGETRVFCFSLASDVVEARRF